MRLGVQFNPGDPSIHKSMDRPTHRIVHLADWRFLPKDLFAADIRDVAEEPVSDAEIDDLYEEFLLWR